MLDTKYIYSNYKKSIAEDKLATAILAYLYSSLPKSELQVKENFPKETNISIKLAELHKASLIISTEDNCWKITQLGKAILLRLNIAEAILNYQVKNLDLGETDERFLISCIKSQTSFQETYVNLVSSFIKTLQESVLGDKAPQKKTKELITSILYAFVVGLDSNVRRLGHMEYPDFVINLLETVDFDYWKDHKTSLRKQRHLLIDRCFSAQNHIRYSNLCFVEPEKVVNTEINEVVKKINEIRTVNPLVNQEIDNDFKIFISLPMVNENPFLQEGLQKWHLLVDEGIDSLKDKLNAESEVEFNLQSWYPQISHFSNYKIRQVYTGHSKFSAQSLENLDSVELEKLIRDAQRILQNRKL